MPRRVYQDRRGYRDESRRSLPAREDRERCQSLDRNRSSGLISAPRSRPRSWSRGEVRTETMSFAQIGVKYWLVPFDMQEDANGPFERPGNINLNRIEHGNR